jgi:outer membrane protein
MKIRFSILAVLALGICSQAALARDSSWKVRVRTLHIDTANESDRVLNTGDNDRIHVSNKTVPEVDISYFLTSNIAAELILTYPQKHNVYLDGDKIGTFEHLPPTLTLQYHFAPESAISPYVGAGINYTRISSVHLLDGAASLENDSIGLALQAGLDFNIDKNWSINLDVKKVQIRSDVYLSGDKISRVKVDPMLIGVGVGYRF